MYSLNVPVPGKVGARAADLAREVPGASRRVRGERTLVCKRLGDGREHDLAARLREALAGTPTFEARVHAVDLFESPPTGQGPVVYLAVRSPPLRRLHERLCEHFEPVPGFEGDGYTPHVTAARGGALGTARAISGPIDPIDWTVSAVELYDPRTHEPVRRFSLPQ